MAGGAALVRQLRKLVAAVNGSNLALEPYRDIRSLAAGSGLSAHVSSSPWGTSSASGIARTTGIDRPGTTGAPSSRLASACWRRQLPRCRPRMFHGLSRRLAWAPS